MTSVLCYPCPTCLAHLPVAHRWNPWWILTYLETQLSWQPFPFVPHHPPGEMGQIEAGKYITGAVSPVRKRIIRRIEGKCSAISSLDWCLKLPIHSFKGTDSFKTQSFSYVNKTWNVLGVDEHNISPKLYFPFHIFLQILKGMKSFLQILENHINVDFSDFTFLSNEFSFLFVLKLLARLEGRSSLKEMEPILFADEDSPVQGKNTTLNKKCHECSFIKEVFVYMRSYVYCVHMLQVRGDTG